MRSPTDPHRTSSAAPPNGAIIDCFRRHRTRMVTFFLGAILLVGLALLIVPRKYISEAKIFVRVGRESIGLDPTATTGQTLSMHESRESEIASMLDILGSRVVLERVVDRLGPAFVLGDSDQIVSVDTGQRSDDQAISNETLLTREKAIRHLNDEIKATHTKKSNVATIVYRDKSAERARFILATFVEEFERTHIRANRTSGSFEFFETQTEVLRSQFQEASHQLNEAKAAIDAASVDQRRASLQGQLTNVEQNILTAQADLESAEAMILGLDATLNRIPEKATTKEVTGFPDDSIGTARRRIVELELLEERLLVDFTESHPDVIALRRQRELARQSLESADGSESQSTNEDNPVHRELRLDRLKQEALVESLKARLASLQSQRDRLVAQLRVLNSAETEIAELQQRVDLLLQKYTSYSERREQARIDSALGNEQISNVNVVQPASFVPKAVSPSYKLVLLLGGMFGTVGAVCLAIATELKERPEYIAAIWRSVFDPQPGVARQAPQRTSEEIEAEIAELDELLADA